MRVWRAYLSADERDFLYYVLDHTIDRNQEVLDVTIDQMIAGKADAASDFKWALAPVGFARRTLERLIRKLADMGALIVDAVRNKCTRIRLNTEWVPASGELNMLVPKRLQITANLADMDEFGVSNNRQSGGPIENDITDMNNPPSAELRSTGGSFLAQPRGQKAPTPERTNPLPISPAAPEPTRTAADMHSLAASQTRSLSVEAARQAREKDTVDAYAQTWRDAWQEGFPLAPCPAWSKQDGIIVRAALKTRFTAAKERHDFLGFIVRNWATIMSKHFTWMKGGHPALPAIKFWCSGKLIGHFLDAYADRARYARIEMLPAEARDVETHMASGMTHDNALLAVAERRALSKMKANERVVRKHNGGMMQQAEAMRAKNVEEAKRLAAERYQIAQEQQKEAPAEEPKRVVEALPELDKLPPIELIELPPVDMNFWK